ncbi:MAG: FAD-dependent oxidoreductase [Halanaerobiales bacterium]
MLKYIASRGLGYLLIVLICLLSFSFILPANVLASPDNDLLESNLSEKLNENDFELINEEKFSLVVYSGEPEGISAAVTAARQGLDTLLVLHRDKPGGLMTYGGLNFIDLNHSPEGHILNEGFFVEWHNRVGAKTSFSIDYATKIFEDMISEEENLTVFRNAELISVNKNGRNIDNIIIKTEDGLQGINANYFIDASQDADFAVLSEAEYFMGGADIGMPERHMAVTLVLHLGNIDWNGLAEDARTNKFGPSNINKYLAWGFVEIGQLYEPVNENTKLRGLNIVIEEKGEKNEVYINALLVFDVEPTDHESLKLAYQRGKEEAVYVVDFLRENLGGFEEAEILSFPEELYVRESRHIVSRYQLKVEDLFNNRVFDDTIALASYPLDYQASNPRYNGFVLFNPDIYGIPLRSLLPVAIDNLFVVGRSSGYSSLAAASARVIPTGMDTAEAAAVTVAYAIKNNVDIEEIISNSAYIKEIQRQLTIDDSLKKYERYLNKSLLFSDTSKDKGLLERLFSYVTFNNEYSNNLYTDDEIIGHMEYLLSWGLLVGGYFNNFNLEGEMTEREFAHIIVKGLQQMDAPILYEWVPGGLETMSSNDPLSRDQAAMLLMVAISKKISDIEPSDYFTKAIEYELIPEVIIKNIQEDRLLNRAEAYMLISSFLQKYPIDYKVLFYRGDG